MRQRVITAVIALLLFLPIIFFDFGGISVQLLGALLAVLGVYELFRMKGLAIISFEGILSIIGALVLVLPNNPWFSYLPDTTDKLILFYFIVMLLLGISVISKNMYTIDEAGFPVLVSLYVGVGLQNFVEARSSSLLLLLFGLFIVWATDIGAYMAGRKYGKRSLWPAISPNKTIEGAIGGILSALFIAIVFLIIYPGSLYFEYGSFIMLFWTIILSAVGQFGDLVESAIKRHYQVKDSGNILPGHGGILDRFDSMLFVFPVMHLIGLF